MITRKVTNKDTVSLTYCQHDPKRLEYKCGSISRSTHAPPLAIVSLRVQIKKVIKK